MGRYKRDGAQCSGHPCLFAPMALKLPARPMASPENSNDIHFFTNLREMHNPKTKQGFACHFRCGCGFPGTGGATYVI
jgi:hypothetical protein